MMAIKAIESAAQGRGITQGLPASKVSATRPGNTARFRDIGKLAVACRTCATRSNCRAARLWAAGHGLVDTSSLYFRVLEPGQHVFYSGYLNEVVYAVRSGSFKTYLSTESNDEQVAKLFSAFFTSSGVRLSSSTGTVHIMAWPGSLSVW